jgi:hypothetical protein
LYPDSKPFKNPDENAVECFKSYLYQQKELLHAINETGSDATLERRECRHKALQEH